MKKSSMIKSRIVFMAFLAAALLLGMTACPHDDGGNGGGKKPTFPDSAALLSLTLGGNGSEVEGLGTPADTLADFLDVDEDDVDKPEPGNATVFTKTDVSVTPQAESSGASVSWAVVADLAAVAGFNDSALHRNHVNFANGRYLIIRVISYNKNATLYYVIHVDVVIVRLSSITVGGQALNSAALLPKPASREDWAEPIQLLFDGPAGAITIANALADTSVEVEGKVSWAVVTQDQLDHILQLEELDSVIDYDKKASLVFKDTENLVVKVEDPATDHPTSPAYYRIIINFRQEVNVPHILSVKIVDPNDPEYIDPNWNFTPFKISKVFLGDGNPGNDYLMDPATYGMARLQFNETGLYVYIIVTDPDVTAESSVEIFINEDWDGHKSGGYDDVGGRYRIGANGERFAEPAGALTAFNELNGEEEHKYKTAAWETADGYNVTAHIPWRYRTKYPLVSDGVKHIGLELQINACGETPATIVWNNVVNTNVGEIKSYAKATLNALGSILKEPAKQPRFHELETPENYSGTYKVSELSVSDPKKWVWGRALSDDDDGVISQWWYQASSEDDEGFIIIDHDPNDFIDHVDLSKLNLEPGVYYFYLKATNTLDNDGEVTESSAESGRARIEVTAD